MPSLLCETVTAPTMAELLAARDRVTGDMVEVRLDYIADLNVAAAVLANSSRTPRRSSLAARTIDDASRLTSTKRKPARACRRARVLSG